ncbi:C2 calcium/lipid-binding region-containing protein [Heterostelium album PN500]|uniref:C2 calcium/lipid-binding region-containing protein n=1 Tax=Heterostelium pallidum (strain ATCC 26659 / Pp 5 / PN500) TaxID=670386 RepID=D3AY43_HETP5|nr:C2 calcium/lipid-binding region-containing protein [Heterostelium album PN500]EFA85870.1 C2 calcium/lipid-binding region-containing protein [Heterostelium album PN500]|eukprot:XP_020437976.1 C2 calcium/lipid-binding region-containing protein [Heterostelium album PN500]
MQKGSSSLFKSKSSSKDTVKIQYQIKVNRIEGLPKSSNSPLFVSWKRGKKPENQGETKRVTPKDGLANIEHLFNLDASLVKDKKGYQPKKIKFTITEEKEKDKGKKSQSTVGTIEVDLSQYAESKTERSRTFPINDKSKATANLVLSFQSTWLKLNGKSIVKADDPMQKEILTGLGKQSVQLDGQEYFLKTETDMSEPDETDLNPTSEHDSDGEEEVSFEDDSTLVSAVSTGSLKNHSDTHSNSSSSQLSRKDSNLSSTSVDSGKESTSSSNKRDSTTVTSTVATTGVVAAASKVDKDGSKPAESADSKLKKYKKKVKTLKADLEKSNGTMTRLTKDRDDRVQEIKQMLSEMETIKERSKSIGNNVIGEYTTQIEALKIDLDKSNKEKRDVLEQLQIERNNNAKNIGDISTLQNQIISANSSYEKLQAESNQLVEKLRVAETQLASAADNKAASSELNQALQQVERMNEEVRVAKDALAQVQAESRNNFLLLEDERLKTTSFEGTTSRLEVEKKNLEEQLKHMQREMEANAEAVHNVNQQEAELNTLQEKLKALTDEKTKLVEEVETQKLNIQSLNTQVADLQSKSNDNSEAENLQEKIKELEEKLKDAEQQSASLGEQLETSKSESQQFKSGMDKASEDLESSRSEFNSMVEELKRTKEELEKSQQDSHSQVEKLEKSVRDLSGETLGLKELEAKYESKIQDLGENYTKLYQETEEKKEHFLKTIEDLKQQLETSQSTSQDAGALQVLITELQAEIRGMKEKIDKSKLKKVAAIEEIESLKDKVSELEIDLEAQIERNKLAANSHKEEESDGEKEDQQALIDQLEKKVEFLQKEAEIYKSEVDGYKEQLTDYKNDAANKTTTLNDYQVMVEQLQKEVEDLTAEKHSISDKLQKANTQITSLEEQVEESNNANKGRHDSSDEEEDVDELKAKIDKYKEKIRDLKEELEQKEDEIAESTVKIEELETENQQLKDTATTAVPVPVPVVAAAAANDHSGEIDNLKEKVSALKQERDSERKNNIELKEQIESLGKKYAEVVKESEQAKQQLSKSPQPTHVGNGVSEETRLELEDLKNIENCVYWPELDFDRNNIPYCGSSIWQMIDSIGGVSKTQNQKMLSKIVFALEKSFLRSGSDCKVICYWFSTVVYLLQKLHQNALSPQSADPTLSGIEIYVSSFVPPSPEAGGSFIRDLQSLVLNIYSKLISIIETKLDKVLIASIFNPDSIILDQKSSIKPHATGKANTISINNLLLILDSVLYFLDEGKVCHKLSNQLLTQTFYFINAQITNYFLQNASVCRATLGFKVKMGVSRLKEWCSQTNFKSVSEQLDSSLEASNLFVIDKSVFVDIEAIKPIFQKLNLIQIKKLLESFEPDELSPDPLPSQLQKAMQSGWRQPIESTNYPLLIDPSKKLKI